MAPKNDYVTFLNADGEEISNDPRWHAEKLLKQAGVEISDSAVSDEVKAQITAKDQEIEALKAALAAKEQEETLEDDDEVQPDVDEAGARTYKELTGKALSSYAKDRGIDTTGMTKVGQVRAALIAADKG